ncbi:unnamed protein product [Plasmodium vivax]|nr:unnamed protein product [Plasmodium vivax]CAI7718606.1 Plasmodium exported protein, unknown function [Plasmodium vivax]SCO65747.1 Plasmodium exported protein, unknown function [Plasmodium vivax]VUZ93892.1 Plasmodium exported protein, unknown function [Plasmodium vivax]
MRNPLLRIITLTFICWEYLCSYSTKNAITHHSSGKNLHTSKTGRCTRILESENPFTFHLHEDLYSQENGENGNFVNVMDAQLNDETVQVDDEDNEDQLNEMAGRINEEWTAAYRNMLKKYVEFREENNMNETWSREIWYKIWHKYLFTMWDKIETLIMDDTFTLDMKEHYSSVHINQLKNDFKLFLEIAKSEWGRRNESEFVNELS